jgi:hypothetical protein
VITKLPYLKTLGSFGFSESGRTISIPRAKEKALIAFLSINAGHSFQRDYLANLLWPKASTLKARHSLNNALHTIRRVARTLITVKGTSVEILPSSVNTDVTELNDLIRNAALLSNLTLIKGEFLADLNMRDAPEFESWKSDFNRQLFYNINASTKREFANLNEDERSIARLQLTTLTTLSPVIQLPENDGMPAEFIIKVPQASFQPDISAFFLPFVGREKQIATLHHYWKQSRLEAPQFIVVSGHAGHGKTRLIEEFISEIPDDVRILKASCYETERRIAFGPILEMYAECLNADDLAGVEPVWLAALREVIPSLPVNPVSAPQLSAVASESRLYEAAVRVLAAMARREPLLVFIDDVQWADASTQTLLSVLAHRLKVPMMLVISERIMARAYGAAQPWRSWPSILVEELSHPHLADVVRRLPKAISSTIPPITELDRLTHGHPYMLTELIRSATRSDISGATVPASSRFVRVDTFIGSLLLELPDNAQRIISALSVIGRPAPISLLGKVCREKEIISGLDVLLGKGLINRVNGKIGLRHDLVRESTYKRLPVFTRNELHRRAANALRGNAAYVGETAEHFYRARDRLSTLTFALQASQDADTRYANDESIYFLRIALKAVQGDRTKIRLLLAERLYRAGRAREAAVQINRINTRHALLSEKETVVWNLRELELAYSSGTLSGPLLRSQLEELRARVPSDDLASLTHLLFLQAHSAFHDGYREPVGTSQRALKAIADKFESDEAAAALAIAVRGHVTVTSASEGDNWAKPLRTRLDVIKNPELRITVLSALSTVAYSVGRLPEASLHIESALHEINRVGAMNEWANAASHAHMLHVEQGRFNDASTLYEELRSRGSGLLDLLATTTANASMMCYMKGDFTEARAEASFGLSQLETRKSIWTDLVLRGIDGISALELGEFSVAAATADYLRQKIDTLGARLVDLSYVEILIARVEALRGQKSAAVNRLRTVVDDYRDRDIVCRLRLQLELARMLKSESRSEARTLGKSVFERSRECNAVIIAEGADSLLTRLY